MPITIGTAASSPAPSNLSIGTAPSKPEESVGVLGPPQTSEFAFGAELPNTPTNLRSAASGLLTAGSFLVPLGKAPQTARLGASALAAGYEAAQEVIRGEDLNREKIFASAAIGAGGALGFQALGAGLQKAASPLYRALGNLTTLLEKRPPKIGDLLVETEAVASRARTVAALSRGTAAREAYRKIIPENLPHELAPPELQRQAIAAARIAAWKASSGFEVAIPNDPNAALALADKFQNRALRTVNSVLDHKFLDAGRALWQHGITRFEQAARKYPAIWGAEAGPKLASLINRAELIRDRHEGNYLGWAIEHMLKGMTPQEAMALGDVVEGKVKPTARTAELAQKFRTWANWLWQDGRDSGLTMKVPPTHSMGQGELFPDAVLVANKIATDDGSWVEVPIQYRSNYWPRFRNQSALRELHAPERGAAASTRRIAALRQIMDTHKVNADTAKEMLDFALQDAGPESIYLRGANLQHSRDDLLDQIGVPYEKDARKVIVHYLHIAAKRTADAAVFGAKDQKLVELRALLEKEGGDLTAFDRFTTRFLGRSGKPFVEHSLAADRVGQGSAQVANTIMTPTLIGTPRLAALQILQLSNPAAAFGWANTAKGIAVALRDPEMRRVVEATGALLPTRHLTWDTDAASAFTKWWVDHISMMSPADRFVRVASSVAGGLHGVEVAERYAANKYAPGALGRVRKAADERLMRYLNIAPEKVLEQGGKLTSEQVKTAMMSASHETQFPSHMSDMPAEWKSPIGRWVYKFRAFTKQQSPFNARLMNEAIRGNVGPLARYLATFPVLHEAARPYMDYFSGRGDSPLTADEQEMADKLRSLLYTGMLAGLGDAVNLASSTDAGRILGWALGPVASNTALWTVDVAKAAQGEPQSLERRAIRSIPGIGPILSRQFGFEPQ